MASRTPGEIAQAILDHFEEAYLASEGITAPQRRYYTIGAPAADDEQLVVSFMGLSPGQAGVPQTRPDPCLHLRSATYQILCLRKHPVVDDQGEPPLPMTIKEASAVVLDDVWVMTRAAESILQIYDDPGWSALILSAGTVDPAGGLAGFVITIACEIPGVPVE